MAESGALIAEVHAINRRPGRDFVLVDAGFSDLMRPAMYGSYHRISVHAPDGSTPRANRRAAVAGPLCESGDVFTRTPAAW